MRKSILISLVIVCLVSCRKHGNSDKLECLQVKEAVVSDNFALVKQQIELALASFHNPLANPGGQVVLENLVEFLNGCSDMEASLFCFECIHTLPPQSEVSIKIMHNGGMLVKVLDIIRDQNNQWKVVNMHD